MSSSTFTSCDFIIPFAKDQPRVDIIDRVWFIPPTADRSLFISPSWDSSQLFQASTNPIFVEFCSGNGSWILDKAQQNPHINWIAVEKRFDRARKIWVKLKNMKLNNIIVVFGEALAFCTSYIADHTINNVYVNFPDPWPKQRHSKHRIISPLFFAEAARILTKNGKIIFVTDDASYSEWFLHLFMQDGKEFFDSTLLPPYVQNPPSDYGTSFFETLFRQKGEIIRYHELQRNDVSISHRAFGLPPTGLITNDMFSLSSVAKGQPT